MIRADQTESISAKIKSLCNSKGIDPEILTVTPSAGATNIKI
jgi:hypothetical protein